MVLSGPSDTPDTAVGSTGTQARPAGPPRRTVDETGIAARARRDTPGAPAGLGGALGGIPEVGPGPDVRKLATNRGETDRKPEPATSEKEPGRNDPCPCGSGKKYKKCHGRGS
jgi:hypothetical protein